jgi:hypothetical protein
MEAPMGLNKVLSSAAFAMLSIAPLVLVHRSFCQQPSGAPAMAAPSSGNPGAAHASVQNPADKKNPAPPAGSAQTSSKVGGGPGQRRADGEANPADQTSASVATPSAPVELDLGRVDCLTPAGKAQTWMNRPLCRFGDQIVLTFSNLAEWQKDPAAKNDPSSLLLVLNGRVMKGLPAMGPGAPPPDSQKPGAANSADATAIGANPPESKLAGLRFDLRRLDLVQDDKDTTDNRDAWNALLGRSKGTIGFTVGVAPGGKPPYIGSIPIFFQVLSSWELFSAIVVFVLLLVSFFLLAHFTDILRDGPSADGAPKMTYSLARCQMAWWFFFVVGAFLYIWLVVGDRDSLTPGVLTLIGISAATGFGSFLVDASKSDQRKSLMNEGAALNDRLKDLAALAEAGPLPASLETEREQKQNRMTEVVTALSSLPSPVGQSDNFIFDLLRDETGVSFHRFQMVAWTVILGFVFAVAVYQNLAMPDFSATLLGLMGISAGTYVGFKIPNPPK